MTLFGLLIGVWLLTAAAPILARQLGARAGWPLAAGLLLLAGRTLAMDGGSAQSIDWIGSIDVAVRLRLDGLGLLFALLVLVVGAVVLAYSTGYLRGKPATGYYTLMTGFAASMTTLVLADDLVLLFVGWELTTLCSYLLILRSGPGASPAATRTLLVTMAGGLCLLAAVSAIIVVTGTTQLSAALADPAWTERPGFATSVAVLVALAAMTKSAQFPFHAWLPDAMVAPAPVSAYLHAAAMVKAGIYLMLRFADAASQAPVWGVLLVSVGLATSIMGAVFALQRTDLKALLAYSTVSHLGLLTLTIGIGTDAALIAAVTHVIAHAAFKSSGFLYVGLLEKRAGSREIHELSGLARSMPVASAAIAVAAVAMAGLPPTLGFVSKELILDAALGGRGLWLALLIAGSAAVTVAYCGRMLVWTLPGEPVRLRNPAGAGTMLLVVALMAAVAGIAGLAPGLLDGLVGDAAGASGATGQAHLALWHGLNLPLLLSLLAIAGGLGLVAARRQVDAVLDRPLFPGDGVRAVEAIMRSVVASGRRLTQINRTDSPAAHLAVPLTLICLVAGAGLVLLRPALRTPQFEAVDIGLLALLAGGVLATVLARSRLGAVISAGIAGFGVAVWFFVLGASDVALTQLLVEILTVVIMVLVLRHMPRRFVRRPARRALPTGLIALGAGAVATFATLAMTGRPQLSELGRWLVEDGPETTGGDNVVNVILVEFRALDTLGELAVLGFATLALTALLTARDVTADLPVPPANRLLEPPGPSMVFLRVLSRAVVPMMIAGSLYALLRGHNAPGGGFIAALIGAGALAVRYLSADDDRSAKSGLPYLAIAGTGIVVAAVSGLAGFLDGSFLTPLDIDLLGYHTSSSLIFDLGVYFAVLGVIAGALDRLGDPSPALEMSERR